VHGWLPVVCITATFLALDNTSSGVPWLSGAQRVGADQWEVALTNTAVPAGAKLTAAN